MSGICESEVAPAALERPVLPARRLPAVWTLPRCAAQPFPSRRLASTIIQGVVALSQGLDDKRETDERNEHAVQPAAAVGIRRYAFSRQNGRSVSQSELVQQ